jgi:hypothetical protein
MGSSPPRRRSTGRSQSCAYGSLTTKLFDYHSRKLGFYSTLPNSRCRNGLSLVTALLLRHDSTRYNQV